MKKSHGSHLILPATLARKLLDLYNYPDRRKPGRLIRGYDRDHALRTAQMCAVVARQLGHPEARVYSYQIACLLHDLGRAGLDPKLFSTIWSWARRKGIPTRPREWRAVYPETPYGRETEAFLARYHEDLAHLGVSIDPWTHAQVEMRLGYARCLARRLRAAKPQLTALGVRWLSWMQRVMLYYYYPERLQTAPTWVRELAEVLVACEQFEAYSNRQRGRDYYTRQKESVSAAFTYLDKLREEGILSERVLHTMRRMAAEGQFDRILSQARGAPLPAAETRYLRALASTDSFEKRKPQRTGEEPVFAARERIPRTKSLSGAPVALLRKRSMPRGHGTTARSTG
jgi:hypothetical protein